MSKPVWPDVQGVVFDLDDTLYAQRDFKLSGFRAVADCLQQHHGCDAQRAFAELSAAMDRLGASHPRLIDAALDVLGLDLSESAALVDVFRQHRPTIALYADVAMLLQQLRTHYRLGLLTDGLATVQRNKIVALGLEDAFDHVVVSDEFGLEKPAAGLYRTFEQAMALRPGQLVYVGDNPAKDFIGARERGWRTVRVCTGEHADRAAASAAHDAELQIARLVDLSDVLALCDEAKP